MQKDCCSRYGRTPAHRNLKSSLVIELLTVFCSLLNVTGVPVALMNWRVNFFWSQMLPTFPLNSPVCALLLTEWAKLNTTHQEQQWSKTPRKIPLYWPAWKPWVVSHTTHTWCLCFAQWKKQQHFVCSITNKVLTTCRISAPNTAAVHVIRIKHASDDKISERARKETAFTELATSPIN